MELEQLVDTWPVDNVASAVISGDRLVTAGDCTRVFELASVTKLLSAYGFLIAMEEGVFELDQELGPEGATVRHMLAHASGVGFKSGDPVKRWESAVSIRLMDLSSWLRRWKRNPECRSRITSTKPFFSP